MMIRTRLPSGQTLTNKQKIFVKEYVVDFNATRAATAAGYSKKYAGLLGHQTLQKDYIKAAVEREISKRAERIEVTQDMVVQELAKIAFSDMGRVAIWGRNGVLVHDSPDLMKNDSACISEVSQIETQTGVNVKVKLHDKRAALELLGRHLGMFSDKLEVTGQVTNTHEQKYHIIQEIISEPEMADRIRENFRQRFRASSGAE